MIRVTGFKWVPVPVQGLVRDLRVRWALEEAGLDYEEKLIGLEERSGASHRALQPFGQVPVYQEEHLTLFESGAIVLHIAEACPALLPLEAPRRARVVTWMFAALNSVEPWVQNLTVIDLFNAEEAWAKERRPAAEKQVQLRLEQLAAALVDRDFLEHEFSAGDLLMATVLRFLRHTRMVVDEPVLAAYQARCEARPAFQRALAAQMAPFERYAPAA